MGGTVFTDTAGVAEAGARLRAQAEAVAGDTRCRAVALAGDDGSLARAIADLARAEEQVTAATARELARAARILDGLREDALAADR